MSDWSHGYNVTLGYTYGFYRELAPDWLDMCARIMGYMPPSRGADGGFRYLELGSGQGVGLCLLAAANPNAEFVGVDFNPEHIAHSNGLAIATGLTNIRFIEGDFAELGANWPNALGQFEYVALHGILSWVPTTVRRALVRCLDKAVPPGGLVYTSYNAQPGWVSTLPFQHMARRLQVVGARAGDKAIDDAVALFERLGNVNSTIFRVLPTLKNRIDSVRTQNRNYLVQEYLHESWHPFWFSQVANELGEAKLNHVASATVAELMLPNVLPNEIRDIITAETDPVLRQEIQDCAINQSFRRDIFCRGARRGFGSGFELAMGTIMTLLASPSDDPFKVTTTFGELAIKRDVYEPIVAALQSGPKTLGELMKNPNIARQGQTGVVQTLVLLLQAGIAGVGRATTANPEVAQRFNAAIARAVSGGAPYTFLAAPSLGSALSASDIDCMLLDAWFEKPGLPETELGDGLRKRLAKLGRSLAHDGQRLDGEALDERIASMAGVFLQSSVDRWRKLGVLG